MDFEISKKLIFTPCQNRHFGTKKHMIKFHLSCLCFVCFPFFSVCLVSVEGYTKSSANLPSPLFGTSVDTFGKHSWQWNAWEDSWQKGSVNTALQGFFWGGKWPSWMLAWHRLPETNSSPLKIGHAKRKRESIPTIHFQVQTVSLPEGTSQNPKHDEFQSCLAQWHV